MQHAPDIYRYNKSSEFENINLEDNVDVVSVVSFVPQKSIGLFRLETDVELILSVVHVIAVVQFVEVVIDPSVAVELQPPAVATARWH
jgi:hypothetical protein